ncbi:MAG: amino acid racemase [Albidovulum sp.]
MRTIGILGGMGPEATVLLMQKLLGAVPALDDSDHVPLIVHQNPGVPSRIKRLIEKTGEDPAPVLARMARGLEAAGAEALALPCNTAHAYVPDVMAACPLPFLDMRLAAARSLTKTVGRGGRIGMLASPAVRLVGVFDEPFTNAGLTPVFLEDDTALLALIRRVKSGDSGPAAAAEMGAIAARMRPSCDHLLVACTELSLLTDSLSGHPWTDSLDCLVEDIVGFARS